MFFIRHIEDPRAFYLLENISYTIGRKQCDILISNDNSISKQHASITVKDGCVTLTDLKSRYKTFKNDEALEEGKSRTLQVRDVVRFGIKNSTYKLEEIKIMTVCSGLNIEEKNKLSLCIKALNGNLCADWKLECTHLTVREIMLTLKVLCALIQGQRIVTIRYWEDFVKNVKANVIPPLTEDYTPICAENILNEKISFKYDPLRKTLFSNKTFVFWTEKEKNELKEVIKLAGGQCISWNEKQLSISDIHSRKPEYIMIQNSRTKEYSDSYNKIISYLLEQGKRLIPQQEIAFAVVLCSCEKDCNPNFNRCATLLLQNSDILQTQNVLAAETQSDYLTPEDHKPSVVVPETSEEDVDASIRRGPVTSTQNEGDDVSMKSFASDISEIGIKREGDTLEKGSLKKHKFNEENPFGIRRTPSTQNKSRIFNPHSLATLRNVFNDELPTKSENPVLSRKRTNEETIKCDLPTKRSLSKNPFGSPTKRKSTPKPLTLFKRTEIARKDITQPTSSKSSSGTSVSTTCKPISDIVVVNTLLQRSFPWITKDSIRIKSETAKEDKNSEMTEAMLNFINSFRDCAIVKTLPLVVRRPLENLCNNENANVKNFKKFKKVQPLHMQTTIIPRSAYKIIRYSDQVLYEDK